MGLTIESKNYSADLGYGGFMQLRTKVAELTADDVAEHYKKLSRAPFFGEERKLFFEEYDKKISEIADAHNGEINGIINFLYASDCEAELSPGVCKQIWDVIKDYNDDILYGYIGRPDCMMFKDFKDIVKDCVDNNCNMIWY